MDRQPAAPDGYFGYPNPNQYGSPDTFYAGAITVQPPTTNTPSDSARTASSKPRRTVARQKAPKTGPSPQFAADRTRQLANLAPEALVRLSILNEHEALIAREKRAVERSKAVEAKNLLSAAILQVADLKGRLLREQTARELAENERQNAGVKTTKAILDAQMQNMKLQEQSAMYKLEAENKGKDLRRALDVVRQVEQERNRLSEDLSHTRSQAREVREQNVLLIAREEGRREGFDEGLRQGRIALLDEPEPKRKHSPRKEPPPPPPNTGELDKLQKALNEYKTGYNGLALQIAQANGERDKARQELKVIQSNLNQALRDRDKIQQDHDRMQELLRISEQDKQRILAENKRERHQLREAERDIVEIQRHDDEALRRAESEKNRLRTAKDQEIEKLRRAKDDADALAKRELQSERLRALKLEEEMAKERLDERRERRRWEKEKEKDKEFTATAAANAAVAAVTAALGAGHSKSGGSGRKSAMSNRSDHQRMPYIPMPPPPSRFVPPPSSPQFILPPGSGVTSGGMPISMPQPSIPMIVPRSTPTPGQGGSTMSYDAPRGAKWGESTMGPAAMNMPEPNIPSDPHMSRPMTATPQAFYQAGGSSMGPASMAMPEATVPRMTGTPQPNYQTGGSSMGPAKMMMPEVTVPAFRTTTSPQPYYGDGSSMGPANMMMPEATVPGAAFPTTTTPQPQYQGGDSSMGPPRMMMPEATVPGGALSGTPMYQGGSSMGPATMSMPEPTVPVGGGSSMGPPAMSMPTPTVYGQPVSNNANTMTPGLTGVSSMGPATMAMPNPSVPGGSSMVPPHMSMPTPTIRGATLSMTPGPMSSATPGASGGSYMGPASMAMPEVNIPGGSSMGIGAMSMPNPTVPNGPPNMGTPGGSGGSSLGPSRMSMPTPTIPGGPSSGGRSSMTPGASDGSSLGPAKMTMPQPTVPGGRRSAKTPQPVIPGNSSMGPASMSMPEPTVATASSSLGAGVSMPQPTVPTAEPYQYIPGNSSMTAGAPMPQATIPGNAAPGPGFPQARSGSSASQRANRRTSYASSGGVSNLPIDMLQFESNARDRDRELSIIHEDGSAFGRSPSRNQSPNARPDLSNFDMTAPPPPWLNNPPIDYSNKPAPGGPSAMSQPVFPGAPHDYLSPNTAGPGLYRTASNASSYHIHIEPPSRSPSSVGGPRNGGNMGYLSPNNDHAPLPQQPQPRQQRQPAPGHYRNSSGLATEPNSPVVNLNHLPPNFVPQVLTNSRGISTPISSNPLLPGMVAPTSHHSDPYNNPMGRGEASPVIPTSSYGNPLGHNGYQDDTAPVIPPLISAIRSPFRPPIGLPSAGGMTPSATTRDLGQPSAFGFDETASNTLANATSVVSKKKKKKR